MYQFPPLHSQTAEEPIVQRPQVQKPIQDVKNVAVAVDVENAMVQEQFIIPAAVVPLTKAVLPVEALANAICVMAQVVIKPIC